MTNKPMLSVERELRGAVEQALLAIKRIYQAGHDGIVSAGGSCDQPGMMLEGDQTVRELRALLDKPVVESQYDGMTQDQAQAVSDGVDEILHGKPSAQQQGDPASDHTQCEECKGWGYHENHYEGGGTECGECGGSGKAPVAVAVVMPDRMKVEPFTTIDRGSKNYKAGYNAAIAEVEKLNGLKT